MYLQKKQRNSNVVLKLRRTKSCLETNLASHKPQPQKKLPKKSPANKKTLQINSGTYNH
jgi:hypothetical protein